MSSRFGLPLGILLMIVLAACGSSSASDAPGPPDIKYGRDVCVECGMIINEEKFAAAYTLGDGTEKTFDDVGNLIRHQRKTGDVIDPDRTWVHDVETVDWISVTRAYFVATSSVTTPMGHGIVAFSDEGRASSFASDVDGEVIRWDVVFALAEHDGLIGDHHTEMGDMGGMDHTDDNSSHDHGDG